MRRINVKLLLASSVVYRLYIILIETAVFRLMSGQWKWAVQTSVVVNLVTTLAYLNYHYWFARLFKLGRNHDYLANGK